jgi:hypothetical protein
MTSYNTEFYKGLKNGSLRSAQEMVPDVVKIFNPKSVLDLGCGIGTWLSVFKQHGVKKIHGIDGDYIQKKQLLIDECEFQAADLSKSFPDPIKVDFAYSLEVAEHLDIKNADKFVNFLSDCSDCILFGAAIPLQGGTDHFNEQWQSYWVKKFEDKGYICSPYLRNRHWSNNSVEVWYKQNTLLFVRSNSNYAQTLVTLNSEQLYDVIHPDLYTLKVKRYHLLDEFIGKGKKIIFSIKSKFN